MALRATHFSRVSLGIDQSNQTLVDRDPNDTGAVFSVHGPYALGDTELVAISSVTRTINFGSIAAHDSSTTTTDFPGLTPGDTVVINVPSEISGNALDAVVSAHCHVADEAIIFGSNVSTAATNPPSMIARLTAIRF